MGDGGDFRRRLTAAGVDLPTELVDVVVATAGPMITALDALASLPLDGLEPFAPERRLSADAAYT